MKQGLDYTYYQRFMNRFASELDALGRLHPADDGSAVAVALKSLLRAATKDEMIQALTALEIAALQEKRAMNPPNAASGKGNHDPRGNAIEAFIKALPNMKSTLGEGQSKGMCR